jgi:Flp pilus assembly protein TadG
MAALRIRNPLKLDSKGTAAIEFALIAPVFFAMLFAIIETGMTYFANLTLANAVLDTSRLIRTGQVAAGGISQTDFRNRLCTQIQVLMSCAADKLNLDVRSFSSFGTAAYPAPLDADGNLNPDLNHYNTGASSKNAGTSDIVLVRAFYQWQLYTPVFGTYFSNMSGNVRLLSASVAFRNEPY